MLAVWWAVKAKEFCNPHGGRKQGEGYLFKDPHNKNNYRYRALHVCVCVSADVSLKVLSSHLNWGWDYSIRCKILEAQQVFFLILMIQSHERSIKPFSFQRLKDFWDNFVRPKSLSRNFQSPENQFKNSYQFGLSTSWNWSSPEDDFRQLVSSDPLSDLSRWLSRLTKSRKMTYRSL